MNVMAIIMIIDGLLMLAERIPAIALRLQAIRDEIDAMRASGREPTPEEWEAVGKRIDQRLARLKKKAQPKQGGM